MTDTVKAFIIDPTLVETMQVALTDEMIAELAETQKEAGVKDDPSEIARTARAVKGGGDE